MKLILKNGTIPQDVVKRMVFLAYQACGGAVGMGLLQDARLRGNSAEEEQVWKCAYEMEDYGNARKFHGLKDGEVYCDYVFGRMMKWGCKWDNDSITFRDRPFRGDYQGFAHTFPDDKSLATAALKSLAANEFEFQ